MIPHHNILNNFSGYYFLQTQRIRAGQQSPARVLHLLSTEIQETAHFHYPNNAQHFERSELKSSLRELLWEMIDTDPDIWSLEILARAELMRVQARDGHHHWMRKAGIGVAVPL